MTNKEAFVSTLLLAVCTASIVNISCLHWGMGPEDARVAALDAAALILVAMIFSVIVKKTRGRRHP